VAYAYRFQNNILHRRKRWPCLAHSHPQHLSGN